MDEVPTDFHPMRGLLSTPTVTFTTQTASWIYPFSLECKKRPLANTQTLSLLIYAFQAPTPFPSHSLHLEHSKTMNRRFLLFLFSSLRLYFKSPSGLLFYVSFLPLVTLPSSLYQQKEVHEQLKTKSKLQ